MNYSKKQMQPLITKYAIDVEKDGHFREIIEMFDNQPNYQLWAVKMVFSGALDMATLRLIHNWSEANQTSIKKLRHKNIVAYSTKTLIGQLQTEIRGLNMINFIKDSISKFNTLQRQMLNDALNVKEVDGVTAATDTTIRSWHQTFLKFSRLSNTRQQKFISSASAFRRPEDLLASIQDACQRSYEWNKEDMLAYMENNASDCKVVWENGDVVIINVPSFQSSHRLCGSGRTGWCITRENDYFKSYVTNHSRRRQYFYFDFSLPEKDELAHIGFTIEAGTGITNAHSTSNMDMLGSGINYNGKNVSVTNVLGAHKVPLSVFCKIQHNGNFQEWNAESVLKSMKGRRNVEVKYNKNGYLILSVPTAAAMSALAGNTFIPLNQFNFRPDGLKYFVFFNFNVEEGADKSMFVLGFAKDMYEFYDLNVAYDIYGGQTDAVAYLNTIGITTQDYFPRDGVNNDLLLHKLINEKDEKGAIDLIMSNEDTINVNAECNGITPVFAAIDNNMYDLFRVIISHKSFDSSSVDAVDETLLGSLLYAYVIEEANTDQIEHMINAICDSETYDFNAVNCNLDSPINIACEYPQLLWVVEKLVAKPQVSVNVVNDVDRAALSSALHTNNIAAARLIGRRPDLVITNTDRKLAQSAGVSLDDIVKPDTSKASSIKESFLDSLVKTVAQASRAH